VQSLLRKISDNRRRNSAANRLRRKRFHLFLLIADDIKRPVKVLDAGGTETFWQQMGYTNDPSSTIYTRHKSRNRQDSQKMSFSYQDYEITLLNTTEPPIKPEGFVSVVGDARNMHQLKNQSFDVAFSNSVIEHVGNWQDQKMMAAEMLRVGKRLFLQTPNRYFPLEPHFLFPFFQFLPLGWRVFLVRHFNLGWYKRTTNLKKAEEICRSIRLLTKKELRILFPDAEIRTERFLGFPKSFIVIQ
jgi:SAM-dependent methyltransferase